MALTGDLVPVGQRQVAIGRLLAVGLTGNLVGSSIAGVIGDLLGWRGVFAILGSFGLIVTIAAFFAFRGLVVQPPARLCHRTLADGTRRGRLVAFILLLPWPSRRPGGLRLWF